VSLLKSKSKKEIEELKELKAQILESVEKLNLYDEDLTSAE
jgi:hypothetical protein